MDFLFGEGQYGLRFLFAFVVVLGLIGLTAWLVRRLGSERPGMGGARGRQPRLAVIDAATVDARRRLILIRRDNVEHLLMIGGPSDVVIEPNIVRSAMSREARPPDALPRSVPLGEGSMWPLQPEPAPAVPAPGPRSQRQAPPVMEEPMQWHSEPEPPSGRPPRQVDPLAGLAAELARQPMPPAATARAPRERETREREPMREVLREPAREREPISARTPQAQPKPEPQPAPSEAQFAASADQNLAEMAQRLEAALRRPPKPDLPPEAKAEPKVEARPEPRIEIRPELRVETRSESRVESRPEPRLKAVPPVPPPEPAEPQPMAESESMMPAPGAGESKPTREGKPPREAKGTPSKSSLYDSLEQEMASLLGRPGKP